MFIPVQFFDPWLEKKHVTSAFVDAQRWTVSLRSMPKEGILEVKKKRRAI